MKRRLVKQKNRTYAKKTELPKKPNFQKNRTSEKTELLKKTKLTPANKPKLFQVLKKVFSTKWIWNAFLTTKKWIKYWNMWLSNWNKFHPWSKKWIKWAVHLKIKKHYLIKYDKDQWINQKYSKYFKDEISQLSTNLFLLIYLNLQLEWFN